LEVGPGLGSLTLGLLEAGHRVIAVELDPLLARQLPQTVARFAPEAADRLRVVAADAATIGGDIGDPDALVANLPYNVAVPVLLHCLAVFPRLQRCLVMVQLEVADRLAAPPGSRTYGTPSVKAAWYGSVRRVGTVSPSVFWPVPRVDSGLVRIDQRPHPPTTATRQQVFAVVDQLFAQRRKTVRAVLAAAYGRERAEDVLAAAGIDVHLRPERLALPQFCRLAESIHG
jgi:16S rRNA (adenine1518-N6/adenine1519-N6)-dimethyltransferase